MASELDKAIAAFKNGGFVIVTDDADRENEGARINLLAVLSLT